MNQDDSLPGEQFLRHDGTPPLFATTDAEVWELGPRQTVSDWLRLGLSAACLTAVVLLAGGRFANYVINHVWDHSRHSPAALIVPVLAVEFLWIIVHVRTGGLVARLKIGLGAAAICVAFFAPDVKALAAGTAAQMVDPRQLAALFLATWVFVDGWRDRRRNLDQLT